ncbi:MAG: hypothetical protein GXP47_03005 [Acidobacteria bacterium]|nr:hypothetical protein [Acidobacteriota bacterium]
MDHLDDDRLLDLLRAPATREEKEHLARCSRCRQALGSWEETLGALRELEQEEVSDLEAHRLRVLFRQLGPSPARRHWLARLVQPGPALSRATATRGTLTPSLFEYRAGEMSLILHVAPSRDRGRYEIHGTIQAQGERPSGGGRVVLVSDEGFGDITEPDPFGEFHFDGVPTGRYNMSWTLDEGQVDVEDVVIGEEGSEPDA